MAGTTNNRANIKLTTRRVVISEKQETHAKIRGYINKTTRQPNIDKI
jgi:hypothetical protein